MAGYTREFLIDAFMSRYLQLAADKFDSLFALAEKCYDDFGRDAFREYASLDAKALREFKAGKF